MIRPSIKQPDFLLFTQMLLVLKQSVTKILYFGKHLTVLTSMLTCHSRSIINKDGFINIGPIIYESIFRLHCCKSFLFNKVYVKDLKGFKEGYKAGLPPDFPTVWLSVQDLQNFMLKKSLHLNVKQEFPLTYPTCMLWPCR